MTSPGGTSFWPHALDPKILDRNVPAMPLGKLDDPPIVEVATGLIFEPIPDLDPVLAGRYWSEIESRFPRKEMHGAVVTTPAAPFVIEFEEVPKLRTWFVSADDAFIVQVQHDRFYFNWRGEGADYPRFHDDGNNAGVLSRFCAEFITFEKFIARTRGAPPRVTGVEMTMVDNFMQGRHWSNEADVVKLLPALARVLGAEPGPGGVTIVVDRPSGSASIMMKLNRGLRVKDQRHLFRLEATGRRRFEKAVEFGEARQALESVHSDLKRVFEEQVPEAERYRFVKGWKPQ